MRTISLSFVAALTWTLCSSQMVFRQDGAALVGTEAVGDARQGASLAISADGNTLAVGGSDDKNFDGATWIFTRTGGTWTQQGSKLVGTGAIGDAYQGRSLAISADGNTLAVGGSDDMNYNGATWIFTRTGGTWTQQGSKLVGTGASGAAYQGVSLAISADGNTLAVGGSDDKNLNGATWVFTRTAGTWTQQGSKLVGTGGASGAAYQGVSLAISADGNTLAVGGYAVNSFAGATWIFTRTDGAWTQQGSKLVGTGASKVAGQGRTLAIAADGNTLAVGAYYDNNFDGATWIFARTGGAWTQQGAKLVGTGAVGRAKQGTSLAISASGNTLAVGGYGDDGGAGAIWIFTRTGGAWTQQSAKLVGTGAVGGANQGASLAISADASVLAAGGPRNDPGIGATWIFKSPGEASVPPPPSPSASSGPVVPLTPGVAPTPAASPANAPATSTNGGPSHLGAIVAGSVAALLVLLTAGACLLWRWRRAAAAGKAQASHSDVTAGRAASKPAKLGPVVENPVLKAPMAAQPAAPEHPDLVALSPGAPIAPADLTVLVASDTTKPPPSVDKSSSRTNVSCGAGSLSSGTSTSSLARAPSKERTSLLRGASGQQATIPGGWGTYESSAPSSSFASIPAAASDEQALHVQIDHMHANKLLLAGRYKLGDRRDRRGGGQGVVQFATLAHNDRKHVAVKLFLDKAAFQTECTHFKNVSLRHILPQVEDITDNSAAPLVLGRPLPPMVVMEKGESLDEWQRRAAAGFMAAATIMMDLVERVVDIHAAGLAHRDLKPANVIFYSTRNQWTIIDFGGAAYIGTEAPFVCTPAYAAPETLRAMAAGRRPSVVDPAVDVWALGVMAWELFTQTHVFEGWPAAAIADAMANQSLPWEAAAEESLRSLGFMKIGVLGMLAREPRERVALPELLSNWRRMVQQTTGAA